MTRFQKACSDVKNKRLDDAPQPPALGGEPASLIDQLDDYIARINGDDRGSDGTVNELRAHFVRLQAEVERLKGRPVTGVKEEVFEIVCKERDGAYARTAELEGLLRELRPVVQCESMQGAIDAALAEGAKS